MTDKKTANPDRHYTMEAVDTNDGGTALRVIAAPGYYIDACGEPVRDCVIDIKPHECFVPHKGQIVMIDGRMHEVKDTPTQDDAGAWWFTDADTGERVRWTL